MSSHTITILVFISVFVSAIAAMGLRRMLPPRHLCDATKDTVKLIMGLVATLAALVLGLLIASTKDAYDAEKNELTQASAKIIYLDRVLAGYGPDTAGPRETLRQIVEKAIFVLWSGEAASQVKASYSSKPGESMRDAIRKLAPQTEAQTAAKSEAVQIASELGQMRWLLFQQMSSSISLPMLLVLVGWIVILFFSFGLFAPANVTTISALMIGALSVSAAIFLILELDNPFHGFIQISSEPMRAALSHLGQ